MTWIIEFSEEAESFLDYLYKADKKALLQIKKKLKIFSQSPKDFGKSLKGNKQGLWRYRVGNYRLLCNLQDSKLIILVLEVGHRKDIYDS